jgi:hypothetical protein
VSWQLDGCHDNYNSIARVLCVRVKAGVVLATPVLLWQRWVRVSIEISYNKPIALMQLDLFILKTNYKLLLIQYCCTATTLLYGYNTVVKLQHYNHPAASVPTILDFIPTK